MSKATNSSGRTGPIIFSDPVARVQLLEEGEVVTFRSSPRTTGDTHARRHRHGAKLVDVTVEEVATAVNPTDHRDLDPYVDKSGFQSIQSWQEAIRALNGGFPSHGRLYRVTLR